MVPAHCGLNTYFVLPKREAEAEACGRRKQNQQMSLLRANMSGECGGRCQLEIVTPRIVPRRGEAGNLRNGHVITSTIIMTPSLHQQITCPQVELETNLCEVSTEKSTYRVQTPVQHSVRCLLCDCETSRRFVSSSIYKLDARGSKLSQEIFQLQCR